VIPTISSQPSEFFVRSDPVADGDIVSRPMQKALRLPCPAPDMLDFTHGLFSTKIIDVVRLQFAAFLCTFEECPAIRRVVA